MYQNVYTQKCNRNHIIIFLSYYCWPETVEKNYPNMKLPMSISSSLSNRPHLIYSITYLLYTISLNKAKQKTGKEKIINLALPNWCRLTNVLLLVIKHTIKNLSLKTNLSRNDIHIDKDCIVWITALYDLYKIGLL